MNQVIAKKCGIDKMSCQHCINYECDTGDYGEIYAEWCVPESILQNNGNDIEEELGAFWESNNHKPETCPEYVPNVTACLDLFPKPESECYEEYLNQLKIVMDKRDQIIREFRSE